MVNEEFKTRNETRIKMQGLAQLLLDVKPIVFANEGDKGYWAKGFFNLSVKESPNNVFSASVNLYDHEFSRRISQNSESYLEVAFAEGRSYDEAYDCLVTNLEG